MAHLVGFAPAYLPGLATHLAGDDRTACGIPRLELGPEWGSRTTKQVKEVNCRRCRRTKTYKTQKERTDGTGTL